MSDGNWVLAMVAAGLGSYLLRATPFLWPRLYELGRRHTQFLTYVSFAIAAGIVSKALFVQAGALTMDVATGIKLAAVAVALCAHRWLGNVPAALFVGVGFAIAVKAVVT